MTTEALRRYLQPSGQLRWHPWAPLAIFLLSLGFAFAFGARWGFDAARRAQEDASLGYGFMTKMNLERRLRDDPQATINDARVLDDVVVRWLRTRADRPAWLERQVERVEQHLIHGWSRPIPHDRNARMEAAAKGLAEFRLKALAGEAPAWRITARYCDVAFKHASAEPVADRYVLAAQAYSELLGRRITPEDLAPIVPGGSCPGFLQGR